MGVTQSRVSQIERGEVASLTMGSLLGYVEALGGTLEVTAVVGIARVPLLASHQADYVTDAEVANQFAHSSGA